MRLNQLPYSCDHCFKLDSGQPCRLRRDGSCARSPRQHDQIWQLPHMEPGIPCHSPSTKGTHAALCPEGWDLRTPTLSFVISEREDSSYLQHSPAFESSQLVTGIWGSWSRLPSPPFPCPSPLRNYGLELVLPAILLHWW